MKKNPNIAAAVDVGSNAVRMSIGIRRKNGGFREAASFRAAIRLGHDVFSSGRVGASALGELAKAMKEFSRRIRRAGAGLVRAVATSALREARNQARVLARLKAAGSFPVEVINGTEEARLVRLAVERGKKLPGAKGNALLFELGGGSAEVTLLSRGELKFSESMKIGAVRLLEIMGRGPAGRRRFDSLVAQYCDRVLARFKEHLPKAGVNLLVGTGGNVEALAELALKLQGKRRRKGKPVEMFRRDLERVFKELGSLSLQGRVERLGLRPDRADVIEPAAVVCLELMRALKIKRMAVPFATLRQGMLAELFALNLPADPGQETHRQVMENAALQGSRFHLEERHASRVLGLTLSLFDQLQGLHRLDGQDRLLLKVAAWLHDVGVYISDSGHHKHSYYLMTSAMEFPELTRRQVEMAALAARYHRRSFPKPEHRPFAQLRKREREKVLKMAALLRLGDALDRSHQGKVQEVRAAARGRKLALIPRGKGDLGLERWAVKEKGTLFEKVFGIKVTAQQAGD
jgi:exopolyphosphatase/guanosine-5'-triphosphate,3'-diphosphate pyrophosphatase